MDNQTHSGGPQQNAEDAVLPRAAAGDGQVGTPGVDHGEGRLGVDGAFVSRHGDCLAVDGGGGGQQGGAAELAEGVALPDGDDGLKADASGQRISVTQDGSLRL